MLMYSEWRSVLCHSDMYGQTWQWNFDQNHDFFFFLLISSQRPVAKNTPKMSYYIIYYTGYLGNDSKWSPNKFLQNCITLYLFILNWFCLLHKLAAWPICSFTLGLKYARLATILYDLSSDKCQRVKDVIILNIHNRKRSLSSCKI